MEKCCLEFFLEYGYEMKNIMQDAFFISVSSGKFSIPGCINSLRGMNLKYKNYDMSK